MSSAPRVLRTPEETDLVRVIDMAAALHEAGAAVTRSPLKSSLILVTFAEKSKTKKKEINENMFTVKFLKEWNGYQPDTYQYLDELQAEMLIKEGIAESVDGTMPQHPRNFLYWQKTVL